MLGQVTFGLSDLRIIEPSDYRTFGLSSSHQQKASMANKRFFGFESTTGKEQLDLTNDWSNNKFETNK